MYENHIKTGFATKLLNLTNTNIAFILVYLQNEPLTDEVLAYTIYPINQQWKSLK